MESAQGPRTLPHGLRPRIAVAEGDHPRPVRRPAPLARRLPWSTDPRGRCPTPVTGAGGTASVPALRLQPREPPSPVPDPGHGARPSPCPAWRALSLGCSNDPVVALSPVGPEQFSGGGTRALYPGVQIRPVLFAKNTSARSPRTALASFAEAGASVAQLCDVRARFSLKAQFSAGASSQHPTKQAQIFSGPGASTTPRTACRGVAARAVQLPRATARHEYPVRRCVHIAPRSANASGERRGVLQGVKGVPMDGGEIVTLIVFGVVVVCVLAWRRGY